MNEPGVYDFNVVRGTNEPLTWRFHDEDDVNLVYDDAELAIGSTESVQSSAFLRATLLGGGLTHVTLNSKQYLRWTPTFAQSRLIPPGKVAWYEVQLTTGAAQRVHIKGRLIGIGGLNDD